MKADQKRCAIYTRKSTEDGLEQEFNSLDAQREACEAFILSQLHEGWELVPDRFDDGGCSGGNMNRKGLKDLLDEVDAGRVDVIVVYKVDRLTRSLADFAKIVERLDVKSASFVSVTQAFNTTTSMGRLTLNVLLSFAQFEREVTGERIRDKIAASKKKGIWMGGPVSLGYQVADRKLLPVPEEAKRVRTIMRTYLASSSTDDLLEELEQTGIRTKRNKVGSSFRGGISFRRGSLFHLLGNPIYRGMIVHKGTSYAGEHDAIVDEELWDAVQTKLKAKAPPRKRPNNGKQDALLKGLLFDPEGRPMVPTFTCKGTRRFRYYETRRNLAKKGTPKSTRFAMANLDHHIISKLKAQLSDEHQLCRLSEANSARELDTIHQRARSAIEQIEKKPRLAVRDLITRIDVTQNKLSIELNAEILGMASTGQGPIIRMPHPTRKPFGEHKLRLDPERIGEPEPNPDLVGLLQEAKAVQELVLCNPQMPLNYLAEQQGSCRKRMTQLLQLSWLSPKTTDAILEGRHSASLTRGRLMGLSIPIQWEEHESLLSIS